MKITTKMTRRIALGCSLLIAGAALATFFFYRIPKQISTDAFPDEKLRALIMERFDVDHDGMLSVSEAESVTTLVVDDASEVSGLSVFPNLRTLIARGDNLTTVKIKDMQALKTLDVSGSPNLTDLSVVSALSLEKVDLRGTAVTSVDFSQAGHLKKVLADPNVEVTGLDQASLNERPLLTHFEQTSTDDAANNFICYASYDAQGRVLIRELDGVCEASVFYTYDKGALKKVSISSLRDKNLDATWKLTYTDGHCDAWCDNGSFVKREYDASGRLVSVSIDTKGINGRIVCDMSLGYDARGYLKTIDVVSEGDTTHYAVACNGAGNIETISTEDEATFLTYGTPDGLTTNLNSASLSGDESSAGRVTDDGRYAGYVTRTADGSIERYVGRFGFYELEEDDAYHLWGTFSSEDGTQTLAYDGDGTIVDVPANVNELYSAVSLSDKASPTFVVDYWLLDNVDSAVWLAAREAEGYQWSLGSTDPVPSEVNEEKNEDFIATSQDHLADIAHELHIDEDDLRYAYCWDGSPALLVTDNEHLTSVRAIYTFVDGEPIPVCIAQGDSSIEICGEGYVRQLDGNGGLVVSLFNGLSLSRIASVTDGVYTNANLGIWNRKATSSDGEELDQAYPSAMNAIRWKSK